MLDRNHNKEKEVLSDIIQINNDRSTGYTEAIKGLHSQDEDLKTIFIGLAHQSDNYKLVLSEVLQVLNVNPQNEVINNGKIYNAWKDTEVIFGQDRQSILDYFKARERAVIKAYKLALDITGLSLTTKSILEAQETELRAAQNHINELRGAVG